MSFNMSQNTFRMKNFKIRPLADFVTYSRKCKWLLPVAIVYQTKLANIVHHLCDFFRVHVFEDLRGGVKSGK